MRNLLVCLVFVSTVAVAKVEKEPKANPNTLVCVNVAKVNTNKGDQKVEGGNCTKNPSVLSTKEARQVGKQK